MENNKKTFTIILITSIIVSSIFGGVMGFGAGLISANGFNLADWFKVHILGKTAATLDTINLTKKVITINEESAIISAVEKVAPAVVSIIVTKDLPKIQEYYSPFNSDFFRQFFGQDFENFFGPSSPSAGRGEQGGRQKQEIGGGSGFIITADGYIVTNKHVALDQQAEYTVLMNDGAKYAAKVLARDPINDLAILKIDAKNLPTVELGDSANLKVGQSVIAIGNALGEFRNTVSTGVISGLSRSITAGATGLGSEQLINVIQTDASINPGNSGGPLLNIVGQVIGINTAIAQGAQNIGFAIPIDEVKSTIESVRQYGKIVRPWLGVRYISINKAIAKANKLAVDYGALIVRGETAADLAVIPGSPADKAGLVENDIILEVSGKKIDKNNPLALVIGKFKVGDEITLKVLHKGEEKEVKVKLEEMK